MVKNEEQHSLRIDDLAQQASTPSRTIRFYNTQGLLPPPIMHGRVAYYDQEHLLVLHIIKELKEQQNLPLEVIKQLLEIRARYGDVPMNLALKQRLLRPLISSNGGTQVQLSKEMLIQQAKATAEKVDELLRQGLLFPIQHVEEGGEQQNSSSNGKRDQLFTSDDVLLVELYQRLELLGLPIALPALIRFQLRQLVRSEIAAFEQHMRPRFQEEGLSLEQQARQFEEMLTLTDTLISVLHRKLLYQGKNHAK